MAYNILSLLVGAGILLVTLAGFIWFIQELANIIQDTNLKPQGCWAMLCFLAAFSYAAWAVGYAVLVGP